MATKTARDQAPTREKLLDSAERLISAQGLAATTVDETCAGPGSPRWRLEPLQ